MDAVLVVLEKLAYLFLLVSVGIAAAHWKLITDEGGRVISRLLVDIFWPATILASIASQLTRADIIGNALLPVLAFATAAVGVLVGLGTARLFRFSGKERGIFIYDSAINNFVYFPLAFISTMMPGKGPALLFIHNLGFILAIWTIGVSALRGSVNFRENLKGIVPTGLIATALGIIIVLSGVKEHTPEAFNKFLYLVLDTVGKPTMAVAMIVAGVEIYKLGFRSLRFDRWNIVLGIMRLLVIPLILFAAAFGLRALGVAREITFIFVLVGIMPVSINSISLSIRFGASAERAAEAAVFTHLFGIATIAVFMTAIQRFFG